MTTKNIKLGCLSSSLTKFLNEPDHETRKKKYGKNTSKYYQRIIASLKASFDDHTSAYHNLPDDQALKIDFTMFYNSMMSVALNKKWIKDVPDDTIEELIQKLGLAYQDIMNTPIGPNAERDFNNVGKWLSYLKQLKKLKKEKPQIYESYFPSL